MTPWLGISKFNQNFNETLEIYEEAIQLVDKIKCVGTCNGRQHEVGGVTSK
jgi:hypothetical protein